MANVFWTNEKEQQLRSLWAKGFSGSEIAIKINATSRNSVIGKISRLGIGSEKGLPAKPAIDKPLSMTRKAIRQREIRAARKAGIAPPPLPKLARAPAQKKEGKRSEALSRIAPDFTFPDSRRLSIIDLRNIHCRFPLGDPAEKDFCYCGADRETPDSARPYCAGHAAIAYRPAPPLKLKRAAYR